MERRWRTTWVGVLALLVALVATVGLGAGAVAGSAPLAGPGRTRPAADHVVLIGFDGFDPDYLGRVPTPNLDRLARRGAAGTTEGVMLPITNPSFASLVTGAWPERTGNLAYWWDAAANTYRGQTRATDVPTIAEAVRAAGGTVGAAQYFILQGNGVDYGDPEALYTQPGGPCSRRFDDALAMLRRQPVRSGSATVTVPQVPDLLAVYCDELDSIGHDEGADSPAIATALAELDRQVGRLIDALQELDLWGRATIVLTGDHGMSTYTQTFGIPLYQSLLAAGFHPQLLFGAGQQASPGTDVVIVPAGRTANLYLAGPLQGDPAALARLRALAEAVPGTGPVIERHQHAALHMDPRHGDLLVQSEPGWGAGILPPPGPRGDHGSSAEAEAVYTMAGAGVRHQRSPMAIRHVDVAPTIARLLGLAPLDQAQGRVLEELLLPPFGA